MKTQIHECTFENGLKAKVVLDPNKLKRDKNFIIQVRWFPETPGEFYNGDGQRMFPAYRDWMNSAIDTCVKAAGKTTMYIYHQGSFIKEEWSFAPHREPICVIYNEWLN